MKKGETNIIITSIHVAMSLYKFTIHTCVHVHFLLSRPSRGVLNCQILKSLFLVLDYCVGVHWAEVCVCVCLG